MAGFSLQTLRSKMDRARASSGLVGSRLVDSKSENGCAQWFSLSRPFSAQAAVLRAFKSHAEEEVL